MPEQLTRNEQVSGSSPLVGSPFLVPQAGAQARGRADAALRPSDGDRRAV
jgi:hypothetical protein